MRQLCAHIPANTSAKYPTPMPRIAAAASQARTAARKMMLDRSKAARAIAAACSIGSFRAPRLMPKVAAKATPISHSEIRPE